MYSTRSIWILDCQWSFFGVAMWSYRSSSVQQTGWLVIENGMHKSLMRGIAVEWVNEALAEGQRVMKVATQV